MDVRFRGKSGRAADITGTTEFDPKRSLWTLAPHGSVTRLERLSQKMRQCGAAYDVLSRRADSVN
jgi:hypothetical protein